MNLILGMGKQVGGAPYTRDGGKDPTRVDGGSGRGTKHRCQRTVKGVVWTETRGVLETCSGNQVDFVEDGLRRPDGRRKRSEPVERKSCWFRGGECGGMGV